MDNVSLIGELFRSFWGFFQLEHPLLGISYGSIFIGFFVICFAATLLRPLLGIASGAIHSFTSAGRSFRNRRDADLRRRETQEYRAKRLEALRNRR